MAINGQPNYKLAREHLGRVNRRFQLPLLGEIQAENYTKFGIFALGALALYLYYRSASR